MKLSEFKTRGYQIKENAMVNMITYLVDLNEVEEINEDTVLSGEVEDVSYSDESSTYDVFDKQGKLIGSDLYFDELSAFIEKLS